MIRTILVPLTAEMPSEALLDAALVLARKVNAHIRALFMLPNPDVVLANIPDVILAAGVTREVIERETQEAAARASSNLSLGDLATMLRKKPAGGSIPVLRRGQSKSAKSRSW